MAYMMLGATTLFLDRYGMIIERVVEVPKKG